MFSSHESGTTIHFNQIHSKDGSRLKQQMISAKTGESVPKNEIVKGYEFAKGQYVLFSAEELKAIEEDTTHTIDIAEFVPGDKVERIYLEKIYFLGPGQRRCSCVSIVVAGTKKIG